MTSSHDDSSGSTGRPGEHSDGGDRDRIEQIDDTYSEVDPDDVAEDAIDYFDGAPSTESERRASGQEPGRERRTA